MPTFRVTWEIDIEADDPEAAARAARATQLRPDSWATVFEVVGEHVRETVDLTELERSRNV